MLLFSITREYQNAIKVFKNSQPNIPVAVTNENDKEIPK